MTTVDLARPEVLTPVGQRCLRQLMRSWFDFERRLASVPVLRRLDAGTFSLTDYRSLLLNLRPQVIEGSRWISRAASSFDSNHSDVRSIIIGHAQDEHRDYEILEADFVTAGGARAAIRNQHRNLGTEILHGYLMYRASEPNPIGMLGAMWIIEGLGEKMADNWAVRIEELTGSNASVTRFLRAHGDKDQAHMNKFYGLLDRVCTGGGWNYGNSWVLGEDLWPYPDTTALALLALRGRRDDIRVVQSLDALKTMLAQHESSLSLSLGVLCLDEYGIDTTPYRQRLEALWRGEPFEATTRAIALSSLALHGSHNPFRGGADA